MDQPLPWTLQRVEHLRRLLHAGQPEAKLHRFGPCPRLPPVWARKIVVNNEPMGRGANRATNLRA